MIHNSNYLSLRKTPKAVENTSQKASTSQNLNSKCSASHANGAKAAIMPQNYFGYSSLRKTPKAIENTSQKASTSQNLNSKCSASHANGAKAAIIPQNYFDYSSLRKTPKAIENTSQKASAQNLNSKCFANHANEVKTPIVKMHNSYPGNYDICAIACVAKVPYSVAREAAVKYGDFNPRRRMNYEETMKTLEHFGIGCTYHPSQPPKWADFPDKAIVRYNFHVVVFSRENGQDKVYDRDKVYDEVRSDSYYPPSYYPPVPKHYYIEIHEKS